MFLSDCQAFGFFTTIHKFRKVAPTASRSFQYIILEFSGSIYEVKLPPDFFTSMIESVSTLTPYAKESKKEYLLLPSQPVFVKPKK